ncbi:regulator of sigma E protease [Modicisalibacter ilicicola DSM 19980]|uniref:Zinc metalloprotease n=1 Tax=Modicisalibacter ilicicola DSM 19980 TaxID=1121942 RepID=A0A1M4V5N5_9GAMM|nr:sigma E protease regulator RseP [Halomonas ilicicola]SHE64301.1 regulator of sigma E protease [Halomonas ilicicola DSM 19980]
MGVIQNVLAVIVVLGLLITFHEFGHFWVARRCGVKVLRFSVGFGKPLWSRFDRHGTEFAVAAIPLGGYVKMLDEREAPVAPEEQHLAFNRKNVWARIAIVVAGPLANFLLAVVAYWLLFVVGTTSVAPVIGEVAPDSPAARAGLSSGQEITAIQGDRTRTWEDVNLELISRIGLDGTLEVAAREGEASEARTYRVQVSDWLARQDPPQPLETLGVIPWRPDIPPVLGQVLEGEAAAQAGLEPGDRIVAVDGQSLDTWTAFVEVVRERPGERLSLRIERDGEVRELDLTPGRREAQGDPIGYIGAGVETVSWPEEYRREIRYGALASVGRSLARTADMTVLTLDSIRKMFVGLISPSNLSGPITIARIAGDTARSGLESFIGFMAYLSISLGVLNLLPIPVLDGGHLLYYLIEAARGRPVSEAAQAVGFRIGLALVGTLMLMALYFDLMRL